jgi:hypothetical protein
MIERKTKSSDSWQGKKVAKAAMARAAVVVTDREASKPIGVRSDNGDFVTLFQFNSDPSLASVLRSLASLDYRTQAEFTIARLQQEPEDLRIGTLGSNELSRDEIIEQVRKASPIGKQFVQIERDWVEHLKAKLSRGEYTLRVQASASSR